MTIPQQNDSRNDLLRWYLLLWVCLLSLWGLFEISSRAVSAAWNACSTGSESPDMCTQLKQHLGPQGQLDAASLPPTVLTTLMLHTVAIFLLLLLPYGILLWFSFSVGRKHRLIWPALLIQGALTCLIGFFVPALSIAVPISLILVLILEACTMFKHVREILAFSGLVIILFLLTVALDWKAKTEFGESSLTIVVALILLLVGFLFVGGFFVLYRRLAHMHTTIETAYARLETASERIEELTLITERQRMARELHDTLAQGLAGIVLQLGVAHIRVREQHNDEILLILEQALASARETLANARSAIDDLRVNTTDPVEVAQEEVRRFTLMTGIPCNVELELFSQIPSACIEQVIGVIREGLMNVARHAHAHRAWIRIYRDAQALQLEVGDDGIGFDPSQVLVQPGHYGLLGLHERAHLAGCQIAIQSMLGQGTRVQFSLPEEFMRDIIEKE
jgi:two-component system, NarL family, sensor histidine kinase YdfH